MIKKFKGETKWFYWFTLLVAIVIVYKILDNFTGIGEWVAELIKVIKPFLMAILLAYLLYIPARKIETLYRKNKVLSKKARGLSIATTYILAILIIALIAIIACLVWSMVKRYSVELAEYISYDEPEISGKEAVKKSQEMMQGNKGNLFVLEISFIGWSILAVLTFGIGFLWLAPYIQVSKTCFYEELKNKNV